MKTKSLGFLDILWSSALILFAIVNAYLICQEQYIQMLLPLALLGAMAVFFNANNILLFVVFATPLSLNLESLSGFGGIGFFFPTEPILFGIMLVFIVWAISKNNYDIQILKHPFTLAVIFSLAWIFITALTSSMPIVSIKFFLSRLWFVIPLYFLGTALFKDIDFLKKYLWLYILGLGVVILITLSVHSAYNFSEEVGHHAMNPYYKDHTSYGAMLAMFLPLLIGSVSSKASSMLKRVSIGSVLTLFVIGLVFSYTRAAWLSLVIALGVYVIMKLRIKFSLVFTVMVTLIVSFFVLQDDIVRELERNRQDSSESFAEHIQSVTNISSDASNLERLNRWNCAVRMFKERPFFGWGPGTYMFQYAPFQKSSELTIISTNLGNAGNAHSEYLGPLSESGVFGMLSFILIMVLILQRGITLYFKLEDRELKMICMSLTLGLVTYFSHGILNNFLDTDKASIPFWGFCAGIIALELYHKKRTDSKAISS